MHFAPPSYSCTVASGTTMPREYERSSEISGTRPNQTARDLRQHVRLQVGSRWLLQCRECHNDIKIPGLAALFRVTPYRVRALDESVDVSNRLSSIGLLKNGAIQIDHTAELPPSER